MAGKPAVAFSFAKKAEPKRVVEALAKKADDGRVAITGVEAGELRVDGPQEAARKLAIPCKNPLEERAPKQAKPKASAAAKPAPGDAEPALEGGLMTRNLPQLSAEDAEALRELRKDVARNGDDEGRVEVAPILMRSGSKRAREGVAPEATKDMFETVPVEAFGEALLRGMGFDPQKHTTKPVFHDKLRDTHLGLGAKALLPSEKLRAKAKKGSASAASGQSSSRAEPEQDQRSVPAGSQEQAAGASAPADEAPGEAPRLEKKQRAEGSSGSSLVAPAQPPAGASTSTAAGAVAGSGGEPWACRGLVVRLLSQERQFREFRGAEAVVLEVDTGDQSCRIKARVKDKSHVLQWVPARDLETIVSAECSSVKVVRGQHRGSVAKVLHRSEKRRTVQVQIDGAEHEVSFSDLCEFIAPKR